MTPTRTVTALSLTLLMMSAPALAQRGGGGGNSGAPPMAVATPFEDFTGKLKLDSKTQLPQVQAIMTEGAKGAAPIVADLLKQREQLINLELANNPTGKPPVLAAYVATATKMAQAEAEAFAKVYALLKPNQLERATEAFDRMAGFFQPVASAGRAGRGPTGAVLGRMEIFVTLFKLEGEQKKDVKGWFDTAHKSLADTRKGLTSSRAALAAAIEAGKPAAEIEAAANAYAIHVTTMTDAEMTALARLIQRLEPAQRDNRAAIASAFGLMRGIFVNSGKWDIIPDGRGY